MMKRLKNYFLNGTKYPDLSVMQLTETSGYHEICCLRKRPTRASRPMQSVPLGSIIFNFQFHEGAHF